MSPRLFLLIIISETFIIFSLIVARLFINDHSTIAQNQSPKSQTSQSSNLFIFKTPDLDEIFSQNHQWLSQVSSQNIRTIIATGDVIPARSVNFEVLNHKDFNWPYLNIAAFTKSADITFINLETPLIDNCPTKTNGMIFCGDFRNVQGLVFAGVDVANLANNHAGNYGEKGITDTEKLLMANNILSTGVDQPAIKEVRGLKFAFLGYDDVDRKANVQKIKDEITAAKKLADVTIVAFHWGVEYTDQPTERQKYLGHLAIDSGADLVIGNHPHWIQPVEIYKGKLITYAHGNLVFDQMWSEKTREGVIGKYTFYRNKLIDIQYFPIQIDDYGQPFLLDGAKKDTILAEMKNNSLKLAAQK